MKWAASLGPVLPQCRGQQNLTADFQLEQGETLGLKPGSWEGWVSMNRLVLAGFLQVISSPQPLGVQHQSGAAAVREGGPGSGPAVPTSLVQTAEGALQGEAALVSPQRAPRERD